MYITCSAAQEASIGDIVDSCRIWESPVDLCGMTSPSDLTYIGLVVLGSDPVGPVGPYIVC